MGLATSEEVEKVQRQAMDLVNTLGQEDVAVCGTVACIKADRQWLSDVSNITNELSRTLASYQEVLTTVSGTLVTVIHNQWILVMRSDLHNVLTYLENTQTDERVFRQSLVFRSDLVEISHLTESLVARSKLQPLDQIHSDLT